MFNTRLYRTWCSMRQRCLNPTSGAYANYGGRGIGICPVWDSFDAFARDIGLPPTGDHSLDRIDNDAGYSPDNVRWATRSQQAYNRRPARGARLHPATTPNAGAAYAQVALDAWMRANSVSNDALAVMLGVSASCASYWSRGISRPRRIHRAGIERVTGILAAEWDVPAP